jgi:hypothetical protein
MINQPASLRSADEQFKTDRPFYTGYQGRGSAILPCGKLVFKTGKNKDFSLRESQQENSTIEIWKTVKGEFRAVITHGSVPLHSIGTRGHFCHYQTSRPLFAGTMVDWIESPNSAQLTALYGSGCTCYVYK